jgi:hypothetical protein
MTKSCLAAAPSADAPGPTLPALPRKPAGCSAAVLNPSQEVNRSSVHHVEAVPPVEEGNDARVVILRADG